MKDETMPDLPTIFISVLLLPVFPNASVAVHVCTPASAAVRMSLLILRAGLLLLMKQSMHVDDQI